MEYYKLNGRLGLLIIGKVDLASLSVEDMLAAWVPKPGFVLTKWTVSGQNYKAINRCAFPYIQLTLCSPEGMHRSQVSQ